MFKVNGDPAANYDLCEGERAIAAVLGRRRALEISGALMDQVPPSRQKRGGQGTKTRGRMACVYIPVSFQRGSAKRLIEVAGREDAEKLIRTFAGEILWFSNSRSMVLRHRNNTIRAERERGASIKVLAVLFDLTPRAIHRICGGVASADAQ